jgi:hypothetical protein
LVTLSKGRFEGIGYWGMIVNKTPIVYGDFDNDGTQDIAVTVTANAGGTGIFSYLVLFTNNNGSPKYMTNSYIGDRVQLNSITYNKNIFTVDLITQGPDEARCCGTLRDIFNYKLTGDTLTELMK